MPDNIHADIDKGYLIMNEIEINKDITQRELSQKTGISLGTVNLLLQKMIKQGLIKMETIPANRVIYMLTPMGMAEKAVKTVNYIRNNYQIIQLAKNKIKEQLKQFHQQYNIIYIAKLNNELDDLVNSAVNEYQTKYSDRIIYFISSQQARDPSRLPCLDHSIILYLPEESPGIDTFHQVESDVPLVKIIDLM